MKRTEPTLKLTDPRRPYSPNETVAQTISRARAAMAERETVKIFPEPEDRSVSLIDDMDDAMLYAEPLSIADVAQRVTAMMLLLMVGVALLKVMGVA